MPEAAKENQNWLKGNPKKSQKSQKSQEITRNYKKSYPELVKRKSKDVFLLNIYQNLLPFLPVQNRFPTYYHVWFK